MNPEAITSGQLSGWQSGTLKSAKAEERRACEGNCPLIRKEVEEGEGRRGLQTMTDPVGRTAASSSRHTNCVMREEKGREMGATYNRVKTDCGAEQNKT